MQNAGSGARRQYRRRDEEVLSPAEAQALVRGRLLKRYVRAAAALRELYDDTALAEEMRVSRGAVGEWWVGSQMKPDTIKRLASATGLSFDELTAFLYLDGPPPNLPDPALLPVLEGVRRGRARLADAVPDTQPPQLARPSRDNGAERE